jgi:hypothetical protein
MTPQPPSQEPTVWDFVKAIFTPWKGEIPKLPPETEEQDSLQALQPIEEIAIPECEAAPAVSDRSMTTDTEAAAPEEALSPKTPTALPVPSLHLSFSAEGAEAPAGRAPFPWLSLLALGLALAAQFSMEPNPNRSSTFGVILYLAAVVLLAANTFWRKEWKLAEPPPAPEQRDPLTVRWLPLGIGMIASALAYITLSDNTFTKLNVTLWAVAVVMTALGFWLPNREKGRSLVVRIWRFTGGMLRWLTSPEWVLRINRVALLVLIGAGVVIFFRMYDLPNLPAEMISDHREKLEDVRDVLNGQTSIFFPRNTGREALQMYLTAAIAQWMGTGLSHMSLKIGTVLAGLLTLPYVYLFAKEIGGVRVGLLAVFLAGIAYWPNVISRFGLRFPLYPWFVAPTLYYLLRALRNSNRNDYILSGLALGIGLHGYTPIRILPLVVVTAVGLYLLHKQAAGRRVQAVLGLAVLTLVSVIVFLPLLRYISDPVHPEYREIFFYRSFTRAFDTEQPLSAPAGFLFFGNLYRAMTMFGWDDGEIWVHSVTHRPALDVISAALFYLGLALLVWRYFQKRHWQDLFLILSIPMLMLPSILSLAFPAENPALNRMGGAIVPVFAIVALAFDAFLSALERRKGSLGRALAWGLAGILLLGASLQNYDLVFRQYRESFDLSSWNTSEMGKVIREYADTVGSLQNAWVVPYPYWVDTILVGIHAGELRDFALPQERLSETLAVSGNKMFLFFGEDAATREILRQMYPQGLLQQYPSRVNKPFLIYIVPASEAQIQPITQPENQEMP